MKITKVSCDQFAGVRDLDVSFGDGLNVVYGKNESGKSTLVGLIARTLFQNAKLDRRSDKEFFDTFFPTVKKGGVAGDFVDGRVTLEGTDGTYTLSKEWGGEPSCKLSTPSGVIKGQAEVDAILKAVLGYGEGVYTEMLLLSQKDAADSLKVLLDSKENGGVKRELADVVSQAFAESDGVSIEAIERAIAAKIEELAGKHWDSERGLPMRKTGGGEWAVAEKDDRKDRVLKAYYALQKARSTLAEIEGLETRAEQAATMCDEAEAAVREADEAYARFGTFADRLDTHKLRQDHIDELEQRRTTMSRDLTAWPRWEADLKTARALQGESEARRAHDRLAAVRAAEAELNDDDRRTAALPCPDEDERRTVRTLAREIAALENALCGMNLKATVTMLGGHTVQVTSLRTGEAVDVSLPLTEAVRITVPDVMDLVLAPADVDAETVQAQLAEKTAALAAMLAVYAVESAEALDGYAMRIDKAKAKVRDVEQRVDRLLDKTTREQLEAVVTDDVRAAEDIERDIRALCGLTELGTFITKAEMTIDGYVTAYTSVGELKEAMREVMTTLDHQRAEEAEAEDVPEEYRGVADVAAYRKQLKEIAEERRAQHNTALTRKAEMLKELEVKSASDVSTETVEAAEREFEERKALLAHWQHIETVFKAQKAALKGNPMQELADRFTHYLGIITDGRVESAFPEADKLAMTVYSADRPVDHGKLSEGTKDTVSLAFRLAVLDHLFPDGGGVIVFDDPFTDMDAERTAQAVELIKACAERHQVIFLTCKEELAAVLGGNAIRF